MKYILLLIVAVTAVHAAVPLCDLNILKQSTTLENIIAHKQWPRGLADVTNICDRFRDGLNIIRRFNRQCVHNQKKIADKIRQDLISYYEQVCEYEQGRRAFLEQADCYRNHIMVERITEYHQKYVRLVETAAMYGKNKQFPFYCCSIGYLLEMNWSANIKVCSRAVAYNIDRALYGIFGEPFHEMCLGFDDLDFCVRKLDADQRADFKRITGAEPPLPTRNELALSTLYGIMQEI